MYHPALDPYHSAFRMLSILASEPEMQYDRPALRIIDFYLIFPELISEITLPKSLSKLKRDVSHPRNPYWFSGEAPLVFARMLPLQDIALDLLYAHGLLEAAKYSQGKIQVAIERFRQLALPENSHALKERISALTTLLGKLPVNGIGGLKERTHLMEHRYDDV